VLGFNWVHPSGKIDASQPTITLNFNGAGCAYESLAIQGAEAAGEPGVWQVRVYHNKTIQFVQTFSIVNAPSGFAVPAVSPVIAASVPESTERRTDSWSTPHTSFKTTDTAAWIWVAFTCGQVGDMFSYTWTRPNGQLAENQCPQR